ncbi:unnamed protein product [Calypogeia fissa]
MASEHFRPPPRPIYPSRASAPPDTADVFALRFNEGTVSQAVDHKDSVLDDEDQVLCLLLEAFPGISHENLAIAYARAERDPNKAAEILSVETSANTSEVFTQTSDFFEIWKPPNRGPERPLLEEEFSSYAESSRIVPKPIHNDDFSSKKVDTNQLKNGHGDFAGASVWRDSPLLANHSRPPEAEAEGSSESFSVASGHSIKPNSPDENGNWIGILYNLHKTDSNRSSKPNWGTTRSSSSPLKLSATSGSVSSNRMQRRAFGSLANYTSNGHEPTMLHREVDVDDGLYSEKKIFKKKNKAGDGRAKDSASRRRAAEDFLHSMLGGDFGIDLVRDVLTHYEGDTEKALETLLNIGSTSTGFDYRMHSVNVVDPLYSSAPADQNGDNGEIFQPSRGFPHGIHNALEVDHATGHEKLVEKLLEDEEDESHKVLLGMVCEAFPTVEQSFLAQVLQAAEFSYDGALQILKESGMNPVGEQNPRPKLDPAEVLRALFKPKNDPPSVAGPFGKTPAGQTQEPPPVQTEEPWSVVVGKPRISRDPDVQAMAQKLKSNSTNTTPNGAWSEYARHRASATEHWETMKLYMKEANAAYNRGDRARAGVLSEKGATFKALAQAASARASQNIFNVRNKDIANNITIDLHAQHVTEALRLLQLHLRTLSQIPSVHVLTVITGQGSHSAGGQAKIKPAVTRYLDKKQVPWSQLNPGCIVIKMSDVSIDTDEKDAETHSDSE